jgi:GrpB-like predicted nucleotidyltransferase (UPF0157 family)
MDDLPVVGLQDGRVRLVPHSDEWSRLFAAEKQRLLVTLAPFMDSIVLDIQHVGSTSIPGIPAKPIIDIGIAITDHEAARVTIKPLEQLGYVYLGEHEVPGRHFFYLGEANTTGRTHHLHMLERTNPQWRQQIGFRDYLTNHPATAAAYGALKTELAARYADDRPSYLEGKAAFITQVLRLAVPDRPLLWTTIQDVDSGLRFDFSQEVVDQPVVLHYGPRVGAGGVHLLTADRMSVYFEVTSFGVADSAEMMALFTAGLHEQFDSLALAEPQPTTLAGLPAQRLAFGWDEMRREAIFLQQGEELVRIIYDPRGPLNLAMLETVVWPGQSGLLSA